MKPTLEQITAPGVSLKIDYGPNNINNETIHIRAVVDEKFVVFRRWNKRKQQWNYAVEHMLYFQMLLQDEAIKITANVS